MPIATLLIIIGAIGILAGTITDLQKREVADWINYSLIVSGFGLRIIQSLFTGQWDGLLWGIAGFTIATGIAFAMYFGGQWGGGDAKMLMGLGVLFATYPATTPLVFFGMFFLYSMIAGAFMGVFYSIYLAIIHNKEFRRHWKKQFKIHNKYRILVYSIVAIAMLTSVISHTHAFRILGIILAAGLFIGFYALVFIRSVEQGCMIQRISPQQLVEGDWIAKDVIIDGKRIVGPSNLGINTQQITLLHQAYKDNKIRTVAVKVGMPFVPAFLIGLVATLILGTTLFNLFI